MDFAPPLSFSGIPRPAFGSARQHLDAPPPRKTTRADRRYQRAARIAAELLPDIPEPSESVHALMLGSFDLAQLVSATAKRLPQLRHLRIATLCYSKRNVAELCSLLETRSADPMALTLLVSVFFREHNKALHEYAAGELTAYPNVNVAAARSHCKVVCFDLGDNDALTGLHPDELDNLIAALAPAFRGSVLGAGVPAALAELESVAVESPVPPAPLPG
jgi:hypothetical protein